jgi:hypothetical protein
MFRRPIRRIIFGTLSCLIAHQASAGDAVAIGYNHDGVWTAVTYNRSSTPKGSLHYHDAVQACTLALRDLHTRASDNLVRTEIVGKSNRTGYVAVAQGKAISRNKDVTVIGRGRTQTEADQEALEKLNAADATTNAQIVYRYFSYGADSTADRQQMKRRAKRAG